MRRLHPAQLEAVAAPASPRMPEDGRENGGSLDRECRGHLGRV